MRSEESVFVGNFSNIGIAMINKIGIILMINIILVHIQHGCRLRWGGVHGL